jgi:predicted mannosyl-3-phosphoglycerate phosphatase (HAD superfamily)
MQSAMMADGTHSCASGTLVIFTRAEGLLGEDGTACCDMSRDAVARVIAARVPLVLVSDADEHYVRTLQHSLGLVQPFICGGGAALYIPRAYFIDGEEPDGDDLWERFSFSVSTPAAAMRLLSALFIARGHDKILTVGLGCGCSDSALLGAVDIPIVVRDQAQDQSTLLQHVPGAYVTTETGAAGWLEAVIGPPVS